MSKEAAGAAISTECGFANGAAELWTEPTECGFANGAAELWTEPETPYKEAAGAAISTECGFANGRYIFAKKISCY